MPATELADANAAVDATSLCEAFRRTVRNRGPAVALRAGASGAELTWTEYGAQVRAAASALQLLGVGAGDTAALMLSNRPEFHVIDTAALHLRATPFSIYNTSAPDQVADLLERSGARVIVTERALSAAVLAARPASVAVLSVDDGVRGAASWVDAVAEADQDFNLDAAAAKVTVEDVATLIYTSGTTGPPKAVELTHRNLLAMVAAIPEALGLDRPDERFVSYLPMAHVAERLITHYLPIACGAEVTCCDDARTVFEILPCVRPTFFFAPPRLLEKVKAAVMAAAARDPDAARGAATRTAVELGIEGFRASQEGRVLTPPQASHLASLAPVLAAIRTKLGFDAMRCAFTGSAPVPATVVEFVSGIGVPLYDGYGLSETAGVVSVNRPTANRLGTVGRVLPGYEVKLADDGELLVKGPGVMRGYRDDPGLTAAAFDSEGWLLTGDVAEIEDGFIKIVDRKKELIISSGGKNMSPANIEAQLKAASPLIGQACCIGDGRPYNVALIVLDPDVIGTVASQFGLEEPTLGAAASSARVRAAVEGAVSEANQSLSRVEQIKKFTLLPVDWEPNGDELTPTMKLKRGAIAAKYAAAIELLYDTVGSETRPS
jgi:long-subunit acyl-CoA synthetase (AMP-forming)